MRLAIEDYVDVKQFRENRLSYNMPRRPLSSYVLFLQAQFRAGPTNVVDVAKQWKLISQEDKQVHRLNL